MNPPDRTVPSFARDFPRHPQLDRVLDLFERGNYHLARKEAVLLVQSKEDEAVRKAAKEIVKRISPEPLAMYFMAIASALLVILAGYYWTHPH